MYYIVYIMQVCVKIYLLEIVLIGKYIARQIIEIIHFYKLFNKLS